LEKRREVSGALFSIGQLTSTPKRACRVLPALVDVIGKVPEKRGYEMRQRGRNRARRESILHDGFDDLSFGYLGESRPGARKHEFLFQLFLDLS
jgi:hypothetical protein